MRIVAFLCGLTGVGIAFHTAMWYVFFSIFAMPVLFFSAGVLFALTSLPPLFFEPTFKDVRERVEWLFSSVFIPGMFIFSFLCLCLLLIGIFWKRRFVGTLLIICSGAGALFAIIFTEPFFILAMILCIINGSIWYCTNQQR